MSPINQQGSTVGPVGPQGLQGDEGPEGSEGPIGPQGAAGASGTNGAAGAMGNPGLQGDDGPEGERGFACQSINIQEEGVDIGPPNAINFTGAGVTATLAGGIATVNIPGSAGGGLSQQQVAMIASLRG